MLDEIGAQLRVRCSVVDERWSVDGIARQFTVHLAVVQTIKAASPSNQLVVV